jgi:hypothetical protein
MLDTFAILCKLKRICTAGVIGVGGLITSRAQVVVPLLLLFRWERVANILTSRKLEQIKQFIRSMVDRQLAGISTFDDKRNHIETKFSNRLIFAGLGDFRMFSHHSGNSRN